MKISKGEISINYINMVIWEENSDADKQKKRIVV
jgi:hypothetical protein